MRGGDFVMSTCPMCGCVVWVSVVLWSGVGYFCIMRLGQECFAYVGDGLSPGRVLMSGFAAFVCGSPLESLIFCCPVKAPRLHSTLWG
jgi:hypothetical protein